MSNNNGPRERWRRAVRRRRGGLLRAVGVVRDVGAVAAAGLLVAEVGFPHPPPLHATLLAAGRVVLVAMAALFALRVGLDAHPRRFVRDHAGEAVLLGLVVAAGAGLFLGTGGLDPVSDAPGDVAHRLVLRAGLLVVALYVAGERVNRLTRLPVRPAAALVGLFAITIALGTGLLWLPTATTQPGSLPLLDALFTATSAVCVTGLVVVPTGEAFTPLGQGILLALIQVGGLGVISTATAIAALFGGGNPVATRAMLQDIQDTQTLGEVRSLLRQIVLLTFGVEAVGAALIFATVDVPMGLAERAAYSVFHAVSAFCNAGFSTRPTSLMDPALATDWGLNLVVMALIVLGGAGFIVLRTTARALRTPGDPAVWRGGYAVQSRLVWRVSAALLVLGAACFFALEPGASLAADVPLGERVLKSLFQSVTTRTAGFSTVDLGAVGPAMAVVMIGLMFVGASPGSTGGGIKTSTLALAGAFVREQLRGSDRVDLFGRTVAPAVVRRALAVVLFGLAVVSLSTVALLVTEARQPVLDVWFEAVSAFGTAGLSRGLTPELSATGRGIVIANMFLGRVGLLALAVFLASQERRRPYALPETTVMVA